MKNLSIVLLGFLAIVGAILAWASMPVAGIWLLYTLLITQAGFWGTMGAALGCGILGIILGYAMFIFCGAGATVLATG